MIMFFFFFSVPYIAIIGDIVNSKKLDDRHAVQIKLKSLLKRIDEKYTDDSASNFMITLGDEFQGLLKCGNNVMNIISEIELEMYPIKMRFGIGLGSIETEINREIPLGADGPAYHNARKMIEELKKLEKRNMANYSKMMIATEGDNSDIDMLLNSILSLCATIQSKWTNRQREIIYSYIENEKNQYETADKLKIGQSSVNKALTGSGYYSYQKAIETVSTALSSVKGDHYV
ncbi:MAG: SatD family protein [Sedimentibacter sp.]